MILLLIMVSVAGAQDVAPTVAQIRESYNNLNFARTIALSERAIAVYQNYPPESLVQIYQYRAMAFYSTDMEQEAAASFTSALSLEPDLKLDPATVSPKIRNFFEDVKKKQTDKSAGTGAEKEIRYVMQEDIRPQAAWRSALLPGWGQLYKEQRVKGFCIVSGFMLNTVGLITAAIYENSAHDAYRNALQPAEIDSKYNEYEKWNNIRRILTGTEIVIWVYAFGDALWSPVENGSLLSITISPTFISAAINF
jgi:hypothetical protein